MTDRSFRFGVGLLTTHTRSEWQDKARQAEDLGYDVIMASDHLGELAPFPALVSAAEVTSRPRLGTLVLNAGFYKPALLARDVATTDLLVDGRLEVGLGSGYAAEEFDAAELPFPSAGKRIEYLGHVICELRRSLTAGDQTVPPLMIAGYGDRVLRLAAQQADTIGFAGLSADMKPGAADAGEAALAERIEYVRDAAGDRFAELELNLLVQAVAVAGKGEPDLAVPRAFFPDASEEDMLQLPGVLHGSEQEIAETLLRYREDFGLTYFTLVDTNVVDFAKVINLLR